jgi:hypothetical protein
LERDILEYILLNTLEYSRILIKYRRNTMQAQGVNWMQWITGVVLVLFFILMLAGVFKSDVNVEQPNISVPTAEEIAALIVIPTTDSDTLDKICENTEGCEFYEPRRHNKLRILSSLDREDAWDDFRDELEVIGDIDAEDVRFQYEMKDYQIRAYSLQDKKDDNWEVKVFVKITYWDEFDEHDKDRVYLLVTSVLDEGEYEDMTVEQVSRSFEF